jgi:hypothetical protein
VEVPGGLGADEAACAGYDRCRHTTVGSAGAARYSAKRSR